MKNCVLFLFVFFILSCIPDEQEPSPTYQDIDVVTGLRLFDDNGSALGHWRFPNDNVGEATFFPNPGTGEVQLYSPEKIVHLWLVPAQCLSDSVTVDIPGKSRNVTFERTEVDEIQIRAFHIDLPAPSSFRFDFSQFDKGFYRIFYQMDLDTTLYSFNIYMDPTANNFPDLHFLEEECP